MERSYIAVVTLQLILCRFNLLCCAVATVQHDLVHKIAVPAIVVCQFRLRELEGDIKEGMRE